MKEEIQILMRYSSRSYIVVLLFFLFCSSALIAQESDLKLRTAISVDTDLPFNFDGAVELQQRFKENISRYDRTMMTVNLGHGIAKGLKAELGYRLIILENKYLEYETKYRLNADLRYKHKLFDVEFKVRTRLQFGYEGNLIGSNYYDNNFVSRTVFGASYHITRTRFSPYINYELFYTLNELNGDRFNTTRLVGGCGIAISKSSELDVYYIFENEFNVYLPKDAYILGLAYSYSF